MSFISNILGGIGKLLESIFPFLFSALKEAWNNLSPTQQQSLINSGTIGQYLKNNLTILGTDLVTLIAKDTGLDPAIVTSTLTGLAATFGSTTTDINAAVTFLQGKLQNASSDAEWNGILNIILNAGATLLSGGALNWVHIALGLGEWVYQTFIAPKTAAIVAASAAFVSIANTAVNQMQASPNLPPPVQTV